MSGKFFHKQPPTNIHGCFLKRLKKRLCFLQWHISKKKKKIWQPHVVQLLHRVHQKKVDDSDFTSNKTKVINQKKKKSNKPQKMENNELVEER